MRGMLGSWLLASLLLWQPGVSAAPPSLQAYTENLPPLNYEQGGQPRGFSVELLKLMAAEAGLDLRVQVLPWARAKSLAAQEPGSLLFTLTRLPEREDQYQWVGPVGPRRIQIYKLRRRAEIRASDLPGLAAYRIGVVRESAVARQLLAEGLDEKRQISWARDDESNLRMLLAGRMEGIAMLDWAALWHLRRLGLPASTLQPLFTYSASPDYWFGLHPQSDPELRLKLQSALDRLKRDGRYDALLRRYL